MATSGGTPIALKALRWGWLPLGLLTGSGLVAAFGSGRQAWAGVGLYVGANLVGTLILIQAGNETARRRDVEFVGLADGARLSFIAQLPLGVLAALIEGI